MSDKVGYLVGTTKGRDHIQWPTITLAQLATLGYSRTAGVNLAVIMAMAWRVKKWRISSGAASVSGVATTSGATELVTSSFTIPEQDMPVYGNGPIATRERDLVSIFGISQTYGFRGLRNGGFKKISGGPFDPAPSQIFVNESTTYDYSNPSAPPPFNEDHQSGTFPQLLQLNYAMFGDATNAEYVGFDSIAQLFYPFLNTGALLFGHFCRVGLSVKTAESNGTLTVESLVAPAVIFPLRIEMPIITGAFGAVPATTTSGGIDLTMTAIEFWPYANSQDLPVYDAATGAQLRDPFS